MVKSNLTSRVYDDMDPDLLKFIRRYVDSFIKWDLLLFFHKNPHTIDTVENIARYAGRDPESVRLEILELANRGILEETEMGDMVIYALNSSPEIQAQLQRFVTASKDQQFRVRATYHVIRDMRKQ
jgi:predicted transcriptional regulator of viral defense system